MKRALWIFIGVVLFVASNANAARYTGKISQVWIEPSSGDYVLLVMDQMPERDGCYQNEIYHYAFSINGDAGSAMLSMALAAYVAQKEVRVHGSGSCSLHPAVETVENLRVQ